ncbi:MAG: nuclear transport factor 2 family protein [Rudaea sp.]|nr:nuclear transport factor 2 family protein [Rudaea sp.]
MKITTLMGIALLGCMHVACAGTAEDNVTATKEIRAALMRWMQAADKDDWKTALDVWAPDLVGWVGSDGVVTYAQQADLVAHPPAHTIHTLMRVDEITVEGSLAVVRDTWTRRVKQEDGHSALLRVRRYEIWRRQPDKQWKISRFIESPSANSPEIPRR